ncbi:allantoinase AllB [candidate division KSB1 bacterium]|nr:allantoinase AllB [candidate division KSB1 bacterium]
MPLRQPDYALLSRNIATQNEVRAAAILIKNGKIIALVAPDAIPADCPTTDVGEHTILPGLVDPHVHLHAPNESSWHGFTTTTRAAAAGGVTTLVDMPINGETVSTKVHAIKQKQHAAKGNLWVDCGFYGGVVPSNKEQLEPLIAEGVLGLKAHMIDSHRPEFPRIDEKRLRRVLEMLARYDIPLLVHAEMRQAIHNEQNGVAETMYAYPQFLASRPRAWENRAVHRLVRLARETQTHIHIVHLSSADTIPALREARQAGVPLTIETCPHYLFFAAEQIRDGDTRFKCLPPIREQENRELLWQALHEGVIDFVASDHAPVERPASVEISDFLQAPAGFPSLQLTLPAIWTAAKKRGIGIQQVVSWLSTRPAAFIGLGAQKGKIAPGYDADLVIFDTEKSIHIPREMMAQSEQATPYEGQTLQGEIIATYLRGEKIYERGHFASAPKGRILQKQRNGVLVKS